MSHPTPATAATAETGNLVFKIVDNAFAGVLAFDHGASEERPRGHDARGRDPARGDQGGRDGAGPHVPRLSEQHAASALPDRLNAQIVRHQFRLSLRPGRPQTSLPEHLALIEAVCSGDAAAAENAAKNHLASVAEALRQSAESAETD